MLIKSFVPVALAIGLFVWASALDAQQAWLVTYGTAERVEEQFGHNAIWVRDPARGIDRVYNFGYFDFDQPGFYYQFLFGEMIYFALARSPEQELAYYRSRDRDVRAQLLNLSLPQLRRLTDWLEARIQPETRDFRYDYYFNNCSNRIRDGLDFALNGRLRDWARNRPARLNFRGHTRRMLADAPLLYLGVQAALGRPADRPRTLWEEMFLPEVVAATVAEIEAEHDGRAQPLVTAERILYQSGRPDDPHEPKFAWGLVLAGLVGTLALILAPLGLFRRHRFARLAGARLWLISSSLAGLLLAFLWLATDHQAAWRNENLLLFNPLLIVLLRFGGGRLERIAAALIAAGLGLALLLKFLPGAQWNYELLLWLLPAQLAVLAIWKRNVGN